MSPTNCFAFVSILLLALPLLGLDCAPAVSIGAHSSLDSVCLVLVGLLPLLGLICDSCGVGFGGCSRGRFSL